jgi:hypothetical protein
MKRLWSRLGALLVRLNCACGLNGLRREDRACCTDLDAARWARRLAQWERERCGL